MTRSQLALAGVLAFATATAQASVFDRGGGLIYDDDLDVTWLADADYSRSSGYDADGYLAWDEANQWATSLVYLDTIRGTALTGWRLPRTTYPDSTCSSSSISTTDVYDCVGSEMGHIFYEELGGVATQNIATTHNANFRLFSNHRSNRYWSETPLAADDRLAWSFDFVYGGQLVDTKSAHFFAWAVRDGDVLYVPEPASALLLALGIAGLRAVQHRSPSRPWP